MCCCVWVSRVSSHQWKLRNGPPRCACCDIHIIFESFVCERNSRIRFHLFASVYLSLSQSFKIYSKRFICGSLYFVWEKWIVCVLHLNSKAETKAMLNQNCAMVLSWTRILPNVVLSNVSDVGILGSLALASQDSPLQFTVSCRILNYQRQTCFGSADG